MKKFWGRNILTRENNYLSASVRLLGRLTFLFLFFYLGGSWGGFFLDEAIFIRENSLILICNFHLVSEVEISGRSSASRLGKNTEKQNLNRIGSVMIDEHRPQGNFEFWRAGYLPAIFLFLNSSVTLVRIFTVMYSCFWLCLNAKPLWHHNKTYHVIKIES